MKFKGISLENFIKSYLKQHPEKEEETVRKNLLSSLADFKAGARCECGQDIWVIGSSFSGSKCFRCIIGQESSSEDLEIIDALPKRESNLSDENPFDEIEENFSEEEAELSEEEFLEDFFSGGRYWDDDGNELFPELYPTPSLCLSCEFHENIRRKIFCNLHRLDQEAGKEFECYSYLNKYD